MWLDATSILHTSITPVKMTRRVGKVLVVFISAHNFHSYGNQSRRMTRLAFLFAPPDTR